MFTIIGIGLFALGSLCLSTRWLGEPDRRIVPEEPGCPQCGWPPWSLMPCLCPEEERGEAFRGQDTTRLPDGTRTRPWSAL